MGSRYGHLWNSLASDTPSRRQWRLNRWVALQAQRYTHEAHRSRVRVQGSHHRSNATMHLNRGIPSSPNPSHNEPMPRHPRRVHPPSRSASCTNGRPSSAPCRAGVEGPVRFSSSGSENSRIDQPRLLGTRSTTTPQIIRMRTMFERRFSIFRPPLSCKRIRRKPDGRKISCSPVCIYRLQGVKSMGPRCRLTMRSRLDG